MVEIPNPFEKAHEEKKGGGLFKQKKKEEEVKPLSPELANTINRLRVLEERYSNLQVELKVTESNMIKRNNKLNKEIKTLISDINELRKESDEMKSKILMILKELQSGAKKEDIKVLQKYVDMWEPLNFVTRNEINEIIDEKLSERK